MRLNGINKDLYNRFRTGGIGLRMAPLIDIIFLLLIFFLVAAKWRVQEDLLPLKMAVASESAPAISIEPLVIQISENNVGCSVSIGTNQPVTIGEDDIAEELSVVLSTLTNTLTDQKRISSDPVELVCSNNVKWDYVAKVYNVLFGAGLTDITFRMTE